MAADRLSSAGMSFRSRYFESPLRAICLLASVFGLLFLASALAPVTLPASAVANVYTEEPPPPTPTDNNGNGGNGGSKSGGNDTPVSNSGSDGSDGSGDSGSTGSGSGGSSDSNAGSGKPSKQYSDGQYDPATDSDNDKAEKNVKSDDSDESTISAAPASGDGDDGGSSLPLILAIIIGVPLIAGGGYLLWRHFRGSDDETRDRLKSALGGSDGAGSSTGSGPAGS